MSSDTSTIQLTLFGIFKCFMKINHHFFYVLLHVAIIGIFDSEFPIICSFRSATWSVSTFPNMIFYRACMTEF